MITSVPPRLTGKLIDYGKLYGVHLLSSILKKSGRKSNRSIPVYEINKSLASSVVDAYWGEHTVTSLDFNSSFESDYYYKWLISEYPFLYDYMEFGKERNTEVILDYGCGPGNDMYRLTVHNHAKKIIGADVSKKAIKKALGRLGLYDFNSDCSFYLLSDSDPKLPFEAAYFDHINCAGVLMHTSFPEKIIEEFYRVLKSGGTCNIMVYNRDSLFFHLYVAYYIQIVKGKFQEMSTYEAFNRSTDGADCPLARCYAPPEFMSICNGSGFKVNYKGGYFSKDELWIIKKYLPQALCSPLLEEEHQSFLRALTFDGNGIPYFNGNTAGQGAVYQLSK